VSLQAVLDAVVVPTVAKEVDPAAVRSTS
jgi:hypothetical protein